MNLILTLSPATLIRRALAALRGAPLRRAIATGCALALVLASCASEEPAATAPAAGAPAPPPAEPTAPPPAEPATPPPAEPATPPSPTEAPAAATEIDGDQPPAQIIATTTIWADVTRNVACGGLAEVESIIPPVADPHDFEASMADRARLDAADLIVENGLGLEQALADTLASAVADGTPIFSVAEQVTTIEFDADMFGGHGHDEDDHDEDDHDEDDHDEDDHDEEDHDEEDHDEEDHDEEHGHDHGSEDPHVWLDPVRVAQAVESLAAVLVDQHGLDAGRVSACVDAYLAELGQLHEDITDTLEAVPAANRKLVTNHDAFGYFADRYDFEVIGTVIPSLTTLAEPSPAGLEALAELIEETGVRAIFSEYLSHSRDVASALADRLEGVSVVSLYSGALGPEGSEAETYLAMMRANAQTIANALVG